MKTMDLVTVTQKFLDDVPKDVGRQWYGPQSWGGSIVGRIERFCPKEQGETKQYVVAFWGSHVTVLELGELQPAPDGSQFGCRPRKAA